MTVSKYRGRKVWDTAVLSTNSGPYGNILLGEAEGIIEVF